MILLSLLSLTVAVAAAKSVVLTNLTAIEAVQQAQAIAGNRTVVSFVSFSAKTVPNPDVSPLLLYVADQDPREVVFNVGGMPMLANAAIDSGFDVISIVSSADAPFVKANGTTLVVNDDTYCTFNANWNPVNYGVARPVAPTTEAIVAASGAVVAFGGANEVVEVVLEARRRGLSPLFVENPLDGQATLAPQCALASHMLSKLLCGSHGDRVVRDVCGECGGINAHCSPDFRIVSNFTAVVRSADWWTPLNKTLPVADVKVAAFALEDTLIFTDPNNERTFTWMPGMQDKVRELAADGYVIAIVTDFTDASCVFPQPTTTKTTTATAATTAAATTTAATTTAPATTTPATTTPATTTPATTNATAPAPTTNATTPAPTTPAPTTNATTTAPAPTSSRKRNEAAMCNRPSSPTPFAEFNFTMAEIIERKIERVVADLGVPAIAAVALWPQASMASGSVDLFRLLAKFEIDLAKPSIAHVLFVGGRAGFEGESCVDRQFAAALGQEFNVTFKTPRELLLGSDDRAWQCATPVPEWSHPSTSDTTITGIAHPTTEGVDETSPTSPTVWIVLAAAGGVVLGLVIGGVVSCLMARRRRATGYQLLTGE